MSPPPNQLSQSSESNNVPNVEPIVRRPHPPLNGNPPVASDSENKDEAPSPISSDEKRRQVPIPPPSEPMQYRAIGLVQGQYTPSTEQFTRGMLLTPDGNNIDCVLLGRIMSLVKNHLDLTTNHLWVVYPRTRQIDNNLHLQIVGVWEPENLDKSLQPSTESTEESTVEASESKDSESEGASQPQDLESPEEKVAEDGYFSIRGEVVFQAQDKEQVIVKIRQTPRNEEEMPKFFKLTLQGVLEKKAVGHFWDFQVRRQAEALMILQAQDVGFIRPRKPTKPRAKQRPFGGGGGGGGGGRPPYKKPSSSLPRPSRPAVNKPTTERPIPRPVKRQQPSGEDENK